MRSIALVVVSVAAFFAVSSAALLPFPYFQCASGANAYSLSKFYSTDSPGKFCATLNVSPPAGCTSKCCKSDLRKIEFDSFPACAVAGASVTATINGKPTTVSPSFDSIKTGVAGNTILRLTQLGLGLADDGAEVCLTLKTNAKGQGCGTIDQLCKIPPGETAGVCRAALVDTSLDCCAVSKIYPPQFNPLPYPACNCTTDKGATSFYADGKLTTLPGRTASTNLYCFTVDVKAPTDATSKCGKTSTLLKTEFFANENLRAAVKSIGLQPAGASSMRFQAPVWGAKGEKTLKATPLNWSKTQAKAAKICIELDKTVSLADFCNMGSSTCLINFFDSTRDCCPMFDASL